MAHRRVFVGKPTQARAATEPCCRRPRPARGPEPRPAGPGCVEPRSSSRSQSFVTERAASSLERVSRAPISSCAAMSSDEDDDRALWDASRWLSDERSRVAAAAVSQDGLWMLTATRGYDEHSASKVSLWQLYERCEGQLYRTHKMAMMTAGVGFSPNGETYAAASECYISQFLTATGRRIRSIKVVDTCIPGPTSGPGVEHFAWSPDGKVFAAASHDVTLYEPQTRGILEYLAPKGSSKLDEWAVLGCGRRLRQYTGIFDRGHWNPEALEFCPKSSYLAVSFTSFIGHKNSKCLVIVFDFLSEKKEDRTRKCDDFDDAIAWFPYHENTVISSMSFSPDARSVAYTLQDGTVRLCDIASETCSLVIACDGWRRPSCLAFIDSTSIAVGFEYVRFTGDGDRFVPLVPDAVDKSENSVNVYDCRSGRLISKYDSDGLNATSMSYSSHTGHLVVSGADLVFYNSIPKPWWGGRCMGGSVDTIPVHTASTLVVDALVRNLASGAARIEFVAGTGMDCLARIAKRTDHLLRYHIISDIFGFLWELQEHRPIAPRVGDSGQTEDQKLWFERGGEELAAAGVMKKSQTDLRRRKGRDYVSRLKAKLRSPDDQNPALTRLRRVEYQYGRLADFDLLPEPVANPPARVLPWHQHSENHDRGDWWSMVDVTTGALAETGGKPTAAPRREPRKSIFGSDLSEDDDDY